MKYTVILRTAEEAIKHHIEVLKERDEPVPVEDEKAETVEVAI